MVVQDEKYGIIAFEERVWSGKSRIFVNGTELNKLKRNV